ncbi:Cleavage stimulation factor subunit 2, hinge domain [Dillenia turbinata]|uniref:Cleavage stimulation factor subunit 2, hinge domain n=1 Tax=Dillenia turbinata TaxID=194707 RepID=A0AAN8V0L9_9MAGN
MAGKPSPSDILSSNLSGMSKSEIYDMMSQMKALLEQNQQQARQILIQNPLLTKALFQAQIMLGMVQPPQVIPSIQPATSQQSQQSLQPVQQPNIQVPIPGQVGLQEQSNASQIPARKQHQYQPANSISTSSVPTGNLPPQSLPSHSVPSMQQPMGHLNAQVTPMPLPQPSQVLSTTSIPLQSASQPPALQPPMLPTSSQLQQPLQTPGFPHVPLQPPLPPQPRPQSMPAFPHQLHSQNAPSVGYQQSNAHPIHPSQQPIFHSGMKPPGNMGHSFPMGQPPLPSQPPPQSLYQAGAPHLGTDFNNHIGTSIQGERASAWIPGLPENTTATQRPGPPQLVPGQNIGPGNQPARPPQQLTPEMEKALLQQVMSLTPEQINLLPPEQRNQVLQLQPHARTNLSFATREKKSSASASA